MTKARLHNGEVLRVVGRTTHGVYILPDAWWHLGNGAFKPHEGDHPEWMPSAKVASVYEE